MLIIPNPLKNILQKLSHHWKKKLRLIHEKNTNNNNTVISILLKRLQISKKSVSEIKAPFQAFVWCLHRKGSSLIISGIFVFSSAMFLHLTTKNSYKTPHFIPRSIYMNVLIQISHVAHDGVLVSGGGIQTHFWLEPTWRWCSC